MQPIVGALSDKCTSSFGRRRPFIVGGSIIMVLVLYIIGWTREFAAALVGAAEGESVGIDDKSFSGDCLCVHIDV